LLIAVTGGAGFVGRSVVDSLLESGEKVTIFDNFSNSSKAEIQSLLKKGASLVEGDIRNYEVLERSLSQCDIVVHLAAQIDVQKSIINPKENYEINVEGTKNLLKACLKNNVQNIIAASSAAVYGIPSQLPLTESSPIIPLSPYGESKFEMEKLIRDFSQKHNLNSISLRFFNIFGKGQTDAYAGVITKFMKNISEDKPLIIFGDGSNTRDFIFIEDVINSIKNAIEKIEGQKGVCYNIATGSHSTILLLAETMLSISGKNLEIKFDHPKKGDIPHSQCKIDLAKNELSFIPRFSLRQGLETLL